MYFIYPKFQIFCDKDVLYNGQAVGVILATSHDIAVQAASKVIVNYSQIDKAVLNMKDVIKENNEAHLVLQCEITSNQPKCKCFMYSSVYLSLFLVTYSFLTYIIYIL